MPLRKAAWLARITWAAAQKGTMFPADSRRRPELAPGGTTRRVVAGGLLGRALELERVDLVEHRLAVPELDRPLTLLQLSDVHLRQADHRLDRIVAALDGLRPDLVVLTGDIVTRGWTEAAVATLLEALPDAPLGTYAVMGNWEHWGDAAPEVWGPLLERHGVRLLMDEVVDLGGLSLAGTDDFYAGEPDATAVLRRLDGRPAVVLSHSPGLFPALAKDRVRLVLSGHTHGGQVILPLLGAFFVPKGSGRFVAGWYRSGEAWLYVSVGVGWSLAPFRRGCPPELVLHHLAPAV